MKPRQATCVTATFPVMSDFQGVLSVCREYLNMEQSRAKQRKEPHQQQRIIQSLISGCFCQCLSLFPSASYLSVLQTVLSLLSAGCLTSHTHAIETQGWSCLDSCRGYYTEIEQIAISTSQYSETGPRSPDTDPITPGTAQDSHRDTQFFSWTRPREACFDPCVWRSRFRRLAA